MDRGVVLIWVWTALAVAWSGSIIATSGTAIFSPDDRVRYGVIITFISAILADVAFLGYDLWPKTISKPKKSSHEELERIRKKNIWNAIKKWAGHGVEAVAIKRDGETHVSYTYPLAAEPPELGLEIMYCLSQNYPSLWNERERFRAKNIEYSKTIFETKEELRAAREALRDDYRSLEKRFKSEILGKRYSGLKC